MTTSAMTASRFGCGVTPRLAAHFVARVQPGNRRWRQGPPRVSPGLRRRGAGLRYPWRVFFRRLAMSLDSIAANHPDRLNTPHDSLPATCDVLVIGAGPAGSAAAATLARAGLDVVLVDQHTFPRDKVCGDGLIPDAHEALRQLGVAEEVKAHAQAARYVGCIGPRGGRIDVPGRLAVLPRRVLDDILRRSAMRHGAAFFAPWRFEAPL